MSRHAAFLTAHLALLPPQPPLTLFFSHALPFHARRMLVRCRLSPASCALRCLSRSVRPPCWLLSWSARPLSWQKHGRRQPRRRPRRPPPTRASAFWRSRGRRRCGGRRTELAAQRCSPAQSCAVVSVRSFRLPNAAPTTAAAGLQVCLSSSSAGAASQFVCVLPQHQQGNFPQFSSSVRSS